MVPIPQDPAQSMPVTSEQLVNIRLLLVSLVGWLVDEWMNEMIDTEENMQTSRSGPLRRGSCSVPNFLCDFDQVT